MPLIDGFVHLDGIDDPVDRLQARLVEAGVTQWAFLGSNFCAQLGMRSQNPLGFLLKYRNPDTVYVFACSDYYLREGLLPVPQQPDKAEPSMKELVELYHEIGVDGWKSVMGKPERYALPLNDPKLTDFYAKLQELGLPLFFHVGDPPEFWDEKRIPEWALREWVYNESHPSLEHLRREALDVLSKFPSLKVVFAHFFFLGYELDWAGELLRTHGNMYLDLTPGIEMYFGFTAAARGARNFFLEFADRILVGSYGSVHRDPLPILSMIRRFLETGDEFDPPHGTPYLWPDSRAPMRGIELPPDVLEKIYTGNFERIVGDRPRALNQAAARAELVRLSRIRNADPLPSQVLERWD
ncbi:MAG: amidohydrolase family protein [Spirochaetaceae bacterium]|nr:MAG: amidohydrolase family protein [Spirochaetaceae bacterium]